MIDKLIELGVVDYSKLLRSFMNKLELSTNEYVVLVGILDLAKDNKKVSPLQLSKIIPLKTAVIDETIMNLSEKKYLEIKLITDKDGKSKESYTLEPLFMIIETLISSEPKKIIDASQTRQITIMLEDALKRSLVRNELESIEGWLKDKTYDEIVSAIEKESKKTTFKLANVERCLYSEAKHTKANNTIRDTFNLM